MQTTRAVVALLAGLSVAPVSLAQLDEVLSFAQVKAVEYSTKGHPKAEGLHITLLYPSTWKANECRRPHIVQ